MLTALQTGRPV